MSSFEQIWKLYSKTVIISHTNLFKNAILGSYSITGNYTNEIRLKVCQKSNISEENTVANFGFNCKNGNFSPILSF